VVTELCTIPTTAKYQCAQCVAPAKCTVIASTSTLPSRSPHPLPTKCTVTESTSTFPSLSPHPLPFIYLNNVQCRSQRPHGLRRGSTDARLLGFDSRRGHGYKSLVSVVCCHVEVSAYGRSLVQRSPTDTDVSECDRRTSTMRRSRPTGSCRAM
jgi:hypothetical protein